MSDPTVGLQPRIAAYKALVRAFEGRESEIALGEECDRLRLPRLDRSLAWAITMAILRNRYLIDAAVDRYLREGKLDPVVREVLRIGAAQIILLDRIPPHAAVSTSVELVRRLGKNEATGLVNGVLRRLIGMKERDIPMPDDPVERIVLRYSHPRWLIRRWVDRFGREFAGALAAANNIEPPLTLRVNMQKSSRRSLIDLMNGEGIETEPVRHFPEYIRVKATGHPSKLPGFADGLFSIQDPVFSLAVDLLDPLPGEYILEIGCAPGGKISHIAERYGDSIVIEGVDISTNRLRMVEDNLERLDLSKCVKLHRADARDFGKPENYDAVLVDAPCTSLGVIRRHPEIRYNRNTRDIERMAVLQRELIVAGLRVLKPAGRLVYCACSTEPEEGEDHIGIIPKGAVIVPPGPRSSQSYTDGATLRIWPHLHNLDGMVAFLVETPR